MLSDANFMLGVLRETPGSWVAGSAILQRSFQDRGVGLTVHSRASTLRERGHTIECRVERSEEMRAISYYRLVPPLSDAGSSAMSTSRGRFHQPPAPEGNGRSGIAERGEALARPVEATSPARASASESEEYAPLRLFEERGDRRPPWH